MKKVALCLTAAFALTIIFFTFFGERLYYSTKPAVELDRAFGFGMNGDLLLPKSAVFEEADGAYVYTLNREAGFSTEILTVSRHKLTSYQPDESGYFEDYVAIFPEEDIGGMFVISSTKPLCDGIRVVEIE